MQTFRLLLVISILLALTACGSWSHLTKLPDQPVIDCAQDVPGEPLPNVPRYEKMPATVASDDWWRAYVRRIMGDATAYQIELLGVIQSDRMLRKATARCVKIQTGR